MTQREFLGAVEQDLRLRGVPFSHAHLQAFVESVWPLVEENPDARKWADAFMQAAGAEATI